MLRALRSVAQPVELVWTANPASRAADAVRLQLGVTPGARGLILHSPDAERVARADRDGLEAWWRPAVSSPQQR